MLRTGVISIGIHIRTVLWLLGGLQKTELFIVVIILIRLDGSQKPTPERRSGFPTFPSCSAQQGGTNHCHLRTSGVSVCTWSVPAKWTSTKIFFLVFKLAFLYLSKSAYHWCWYTNLFYLKSTADITWFIQEIKQGRWNNFNEILLGNNGYF